MTGALHVPALEGRLVRLEPLGDVHIDGLAAALHDRSTFAFTSVPRDRDDLVSQVDALHAAGDAVPFAQVRVSDGAAVGMTRYLTLRRLPDSDALYAVEIGGTWLAESAQRTGINVEAKLLLLGYAFDEWGVGRVDFKTDARNDRSRRALLGLGATFEGVLRNWQPSHAVGEDSMLRDSAMYSVTASEWPAVRNRLMDRRA